MGSTPASAPDDGTLELALAKRLSEIGVDRASAAALRMATSAIVDTVAVTLAGSNEPCTTLLRDTIGVASPQGDATLIGLPERASVLDAALVNATAAHAIDFDDVAAAMGGHPSAPVVPVVFALAEQLGASGRALLDAYLVGFEIECRLGRAVHPHHYEQGWHPTATLGVFGACAAAARLLQLDELRTATALGLSCSLASGVKANFGTMTKPLHVGHSARNGLLAALLVRRGYTANPGALQHAMGFFAAFDGLAQVRTEKVFDHWGELLEVEQPQVGLKQFACCGSTHTAILAMLEVRSAHAPRPEDVESIEITAHPRRLKHTHNPFPRTALQSKFSIQYATVRALLDGPPGMAHFEGAAFEEPAARRLLEVTTTHPSTNLGAEMACEVIVRLRNGTRCVGRADSLGRGPADPMSTQELWAKFSDCAQGVLAPEPAARAFEALGRIEQARDVRDVASLLARGTS